MAGRSHILRWTRVYLDGYNISGVMRDIGNMTNSFGEAMMAGINESPRHFVSDQMRSVGVSGFKALMDDTALSGIHTLLVAATKTGHELSILFGNGAEPDELDPAYLMGGVALGDNASWDGATAVMSSDFLPDTLTTTGRPWGVVLSDETSLGSTTNKTQHDNLALTTKGYQANLHVTATSSGNFSLLIQHSTSGAWAGEEATLGAFAASGSIVASEHISGTGTVNRYVRFRAVKTGGSCTPVVTFARL